MSSNKDILIADVTKLLLELHDQFHEKYLISNGDKPGTHRERVEFTEQVVKYYIPKVMAFYPLLLTRVADQADYVRQVEKERDDWQARANKANKIAQIKNNRFRDLAPNPEPWLKAED